MQLYAVSALYQDRLLDAVEYPYRLYSYQYLTPALTETFVLRDPSKTIMDSGLFSFMTGVKEMESTLEAYHVYTSKYLADLTQWGYKGWIIEADAQRILGVEKTMELRKLFEPFKDRTMYVWHQPDGIEGLERMALEYDYISFSFPELRRLVGNRKAAALSSELLRRIHDVCKRKRKRPPKVHLLGCSTPRMLQTSRAVSSDSAAWMSGPRFGTNLIWNPQRGLFTVSTNSPFYQHYREEVLKRVPAIEQTARADYDIDHMMGAYSFRMYQNWLDTRFTPVQTRLP
jgi:hypothetical protein